MRIGILGLLGILFVALKLTNYIAWSWWVVLAPFYAIPLLAILLPMIGVSFLSVWIWISNRTK